VTGDDDDDDDDNDDDNNDDDDVVNSDIPTFISQTSKWSQQVPRCHPGGGGDCDGKW
jgi:hypothetical protein